MVRSRMPSVGILACSLSASTRRAAVPGRIPRHAAYHRSTDPRFCAAPAADGADVRCGTRHANAVDPRAEDRASWYVVRADHMLRIVAAVAGGFALGTSARGGARHLSEVRATCSGQAPLQPREP